MTDRTVPTEPTLAPCPFCGSRDVAQGASREYISVWCRCGARGPDVPFPLDCDPVQPILKSHGLWNRRAASPAAPGAEVEPVAQYRWRFRPEGGDWRQWEGWFDGAPNPDHHPQFQSQTRILYLSPPTTDAIRAQARREALEMAAKVADEEADRWGKDGGSSARVAAANIRRLAGKPGEAEGWRPTHRHFKRGSTYRVVGEALAQVSTGAFNLAQYSRQIQDGSRLTVYQGQDGKLWARFTDEFNDGRFTPIEAEGGGDGE